MTTGPTSQPAGVVLRLDDLCTQNPATSRKPGSFNYDHENGHFPHEWSNMAEFEVWHQEEELAYSIEFIAARVVRGDGLWTLRRCYVCSRQLSGGKVPYQKKCPDRKAICYGFGLWSGLSDCFTICVSGLIDSVGAESNIFDSVHVRLLVVLLVFRISISCEAIWPRVSFGILCISIFLLRPFSKAFDSYLCRIVGHPLYRINRVPKAC